MCHEECDQPEADSTAEFVAEMHTQATCANSQTVSVRIKWLRSGLLKRKVNLAHQRQCTIIEMP